MSIFENYAFSTPKNMTLQHTALKFIFLLYFFVTIIFNLFFKKIFKDFNVTLYKGQMDSKNPKNHIMKYSCELCSYFTNSKKDFNKHILTKKHIINTNKHESINKMITLDYHFCPCGKQYKFRQGLYKHKKTCNFKQEDKEICQNNENLIVNNQSNLENLVIKLITDNNEIKNTLLKENNEFKEIIKKQQDQISELIPKVGNNNTTNNNKFNINVFLNEKCKDAISINEFVSKIEISLKNLLTTKSKGIGIGINEIINENMNKLSVYERPIHCTDKKRETLYIKNDTWTKDVDKTHTTAMLKALQSQQFKAMRKWQEAHPNYNNDEDLKHEYIILVNKCSSSLNDHEKKLFKNICENNYIKDEL